MKQQVFIIIGALIVLLLVGVWAYLLFFGTPKSAEDVFAELGLSGSEDTQIVPQPVPVATSTVNLERPKLRQLTTKPVIGFQEVTKATSSAAALYYVEMGTGHIFSIDLQSGEEVRISGTTVPKANHADIATNGSLVAISSPTNSKNLNLVLGTLGTSTPTDMTLTGFEKTVTDFTIASSGELLFTETNLGTTLGTAYNVKTAKETTIFSLPYKDARIIWGEAGNDSHFAYPKASYALEGFLYEAKNNTLSRLPVDGFGLTVNANNSIVLFSRSENQVTKSYLYDLTEQTTSPLAAVVVPEKCLLTGSDLEFVCPFEARELSYEFPDDWYKGTLSFKDSLWLLSAQNMSGQLLVDTFSESNRELDIIDLAVSSKGGVLYFINKNDNTLWMYEI